MRGGGKWFVFRRVGIFWGVVTGGSGNGQRDTGLGKKPVTCVPGSVGWSAVLALRGRYAAAGLEFLVHVAGWGLIRLALELAAGLKPVSGKPVETGWDVTEVRAPAVERPAYAEPNRLKAVGMPGKLRGRSRVAVAFRAWETRHWRSGLC